MRSQLFIFFRQILIMSEEQKKQNNSLELHNLNSSIETFIDEMNTINKFKHKYSVSFT